ncbi:MAG: penicillin-binding protein activator [Pseudomonadota bacterium]|nr:penicillin-binding protein activator [Pseudomonadota bacterium]
MKSLQILALMFGLSTVASAEVVVLLPEQGALAYAAQSVRDGLTAAYYDRMPQPSLRFVHDDEQRPIDEVFKQALSPQTELVIGPLERERVEALIQSKPTVPVLALNQVEIEHPKVWEFALAPEEDVAALLRQMTRDGVKDLLVLTEPDQQANRRFEQVLTEQWQGALTAIQAVPKQLKKSQGLLLLGSGAWLEMLNDVPTERVYTTSFAFNQVSPFKAGLVFCDIPALYRPEWPELVKEAERKPVPIGYQRLVAFGADAWQLALLRLQQAPSAEMAGRTGYLSLRRHHIERTPDCMKATAQGWARIQ